MTVAIWEQRDDLTLPPTPSRMHANENGERNMPGEKWGPCPTLPPPPNLHQRSPSDHSVSMHVSPPGQHGGHHKEGATDEEDDTGHKQLKHRETNAGSGWVEAGSSIRRLLTSTESAWTDQSRDRYFPETVMWNKQTKKVVRGQGPESVNQWPESPRWSKDVLALGRLLPWADQRYFYSNF